MDEQQPTLTPKHKTDSVCLADKKRHFWRSVSLMVLTLVLSGAFWLILKTYQQNPSPMTTPDKATIANTAPKKASTLTILLDDTGQQFRQIDGVVGHQSLAQKVQWTLSNFADAHQAHITTSPDSAERMPSLIYLPQILRFMQGIDGASLAISDKQLIVGANHPTAQAKLIADLRMALPDDFEIIAKPLDNHTPATPTNKTAKF